MAATKRNFILSSGIGLSADNIYTISSNNSTSIGSGAVIVAGGVGIGSSVSIGGRLQMFNGANYTAFVSSASGNTVYILPSTSPATGSSVLQSTSAGVLSWVPMTAGAASGNTSQNIVVNAAGNASVFHPVLFTPSSLSAGSAVSSDSTITFNPSTEILNVSGLAITAGTASTNNVTGALVVSGGVGLGGTLNVGADLGISGLTTLTYTSEKLNTKTSATGTVSHDLSTGSVFYHSSISSNFTANITNVPTTNDRAIGVTLVLAQGVTAYMSTALQIAGSAQTINWVNNSIPAGTASKVDIVGFSLIRTGSAWTVLGQYSTYG